MTGDLEEPWVGTSYLVSAAIFVIPISWSLVVLARLRCQDISDLGVVAVEQRYTKKTDEEKADVGWSSTGEIECQPQNECHGSNNTAI